MRVKIRVECLPGEVGPLIAVLGGVLDLHSVSDPYPNRGQSRFVRVYIEFGLPARAPMRADAVRTDRAELTVDAPKQIGYSSRRRKGR